MSSCAIESKTIEVSGISFAVELVDNDERTDIIRDVIRVGCEVSGGRSVSFRHEDIAHSLTNGGYPTDRRRVSRIIKNLRSAGEVGARRVGNQWTYWLNVIKESAPPVMDALVPANPSMMRGGRAEVAAISPTRAPEKPRLFEDDAVPGETLPCNAGERAGERAGARAAANAQNDVEAPASSPTSPQQERSISWVCPDHPHATPQRNQRGPGYYCPVQMDNGRYCGNPSPDHPRANRASQTTRKQGGTTNVKSASHLIPASVKREYPDAFDETGELLSPEDFGLHPPLLCTLIRNKRGMDPERNRLSAEVRKIIRPYLSSDGTYKFPLLNPAQ